MKFINDYGLLTYDVRSVRISNYLASLYKMARLLTQTELCKTASKEVVSDIVRMIHDHTESLKSAGKYGLIPYRRQAADYIHAYGVIVAHRANERQQFCTRKKHSPFTIAPFPRPYGLGSTTL